MNIEGYSCLGSFGSGAKSLLAALRGSPETAFTAGADLSALSGYFPPRALRQCDRFSRLALLGACMAAEQAGIALKEIQSCGIVLSSGYGPATPTFDFLDSLLEHGETLASPLAFSMSVHNIPAAVVAKTLHIVGPCATVCQYESSVASGLLLAENWLEEGRVDKVLFGAVDEFTAVLASISGRLIDEREERGAPACRRKLPLGEGAAFFILSRSDGRPAAGSVESVRLEYTPEGPGAIAPEPGISFLSGAVPPEAFADGRVYDGGKAYGNLPIAPALDCVAALELLRAGGFAEGMRRARCLNYGSGVRSAIVLGGGAA